MKKIIVAAMIAIVAAYTQAATVAWSANSIQAAPTGVALTNYSAFLIDNTADTYATLEEAALAIIKDGTSATGVIKYKDGLSSNTKGLMLADSGDLIGTYAAGAKIDTMMILFDANTGALDTAKYYLGAEKDQLAFNTSAKLTAGYGAVTGTWTEVVPEPTSGLLVLLGMGALALRRRRA